MTLNSPPILEYEHGKGPRECYLAIDFCHMYIGNGSREQNRYNKKAAAGVVRAIAKHSPALAQAVVDAGSIQPLILCLEEFDPAVKEVAAGALSNIARHTMELAQIVVDAGGVSLLVLAVQVLHINHCWVLLVIEGGVQCTLACIFWTSYS